MVVLVGVFNRKCHGKKNTDKHKARMAAILSFVKSSTEAGLNHIFKSPHPDGIGMERAG